ncbi:MAG: hypothetical protein AMR96_01285 [Candidatus Adiutrix intracellularis]|jgi:GTP-binding protein|nr:MAG: hypothetical protein AMR96_01285 [Candidatus Adiutrix intracellularis]MDR2827390.1 ribosome biogenesis GTP-binding protein YihA/YsxC [Candidatus Adiutrix intracellularis]
MKTVAAPYSAPERPPALVADFIISAAEIRQFPESERPELAILGRSNSGKSSLLNRWLGRKALARVGATPGRTCQINFFRVAFRPQDQPFLLADLPGYGFAAAPKSQVAGWRRLATGYLESGRPIKTVLLLMDIRREPSADEYDLVAWLETLGIPVWLIATKVDKLNRSEARTRLLRIEKMFEVVIPLAHPLLAFSSTTGQGRERLIENLIDSGLLTGSNFD